MPLLSQITQAIENALFKEKSSFRILLLLNGFCMSFQTIRRRIDIYA